MATSIRMQRAARMLQRALGEIFLHKNSRLVGNVIVTVTAVQLSPDLGTAKVYLSFILDGDKADVLAKVEQRKAELRKHLGIRLGNKLRKVPELQFYIDDSVARAARTNRLLDNLGIPEGVDCIKDKDR